MPQVLRHLTPEEHAVEGIEHADGGSNAGERRDVLKGFLVGQLLNAHIGIGRIGEEEHSHGEAHKQQDHVGPVQEVPGIEEVGAPAPIELLHFLENELHHKEHHQDQEHKGEPVHAGAQAAHGQHALRHGGDFDLLCGAAARAELHHEVHHRIQAHIGVPDVELCEEGPGGRIQEPVCAQLGDLLGRQGGIGGQELHEAVGGVRAKGAGVVDARHIFGVCKPLQGAEGHFARCAWAVIRIAAHCVLLEERQHLTVLLQVNANLPESHGAKQAVGNVDGPQVR
mmetsp:Transcript_55605/g.133022  ORF Transcript_55605/g.133022 Transcript_55605/m.133022 type:complete len:282 (+) Transcript_55605:920-1765(+)